MADDAAGVSGAGGSGDGSGIGQRVGPLPVWGWFLVAAGVLGVFLLWRARGQRQGSAGATITGGLPAGTGVSSVDPLTGEQLLTSLQQLIGTLQGQAQPPSSAASKNTLPFVNSDVSIVSEGGLVSIWGSPNAPWAQGGNGPLQSFSAGYGPEELWNWIASVFSFYNLGLPPDSGTFAYYDPNGATHHLQFRKPGDGSGLTLGHGPIMSMTQPAAPSAGTTAPPAILAPTSGAGKFLARVSG